MTTDMGNYHLISSMMVVCGKVASTAWRKGDQRSPESASKCFSIIGIFPLNPYKSSDLADHLILYEKDNS